MKYQVTLSLIIEADDMRQAQELGKIAARVLENASERIAPGVVSANCAAVAPNDLGKFMVGTS